MDGGAKGNGEWGNVRRAGTYLVIASEYHDRLCDADGLLIWGSRNAPRWRIRSVLALALWRILLIEGDV
jgi:hypothetical protein